MTVDSSQYKEKQNSHSARHARLLLMAVGFILFLMPGLLLTNSVEASPDLQITATPTVSPAPTPTFDPQRLAKPVAPEVRAQVDEGAEIYWGICMACHGDRGQGLTDEWRFGGFGEDGNCWQSGCHGKNHPPHGFEIPKTVLPIPALSLAGSLGRFENAQQLYDYVVVMMPWWNPNSLTSERAWQVTAYLLKMKNSLPEGIVLNETNASAVPVHRHIPYPQNQNTFVYFFVGTLLLGLFGFVARDFIVQRENASIADRSSAPVRPSFVAHLHPPTIPALQARWRFTLGAGGMAVFLCLVLTITGLLEMFYYIPTVEKAAISVETITNFVPFGALIRNLHYWSAQLLVVVALIHLARVIFTGAYSAGRKFNFLLGLGLFVFVVLLDFTGYVLRWDEGIRWALTAGTNLLKSIPYVGNNIYIFVVGGSEPGSAALIRFYSWHIFVLSLAGGFFMIWHLFRVRRDGGISVPPATQRDDTKRITRSELLKREIIGMFVGFILLIIVSTLFPAPIAPPIRESTLLNAESSAPWFFLWVQQLLKLGDPFLLGVLLPLTILILLGGTPYVFPNIKPNELGRWFPRSGRVVQILFTILAIFILALTLLSIFKVP